MFTAPRADGIRPNTRGSAAQAPNVPLRTLDRATSQAPFRTPCILRARADSKRTPGI